MESEFPDVLRGPLWHTTHPERYKAIIETGFIVPNPDLPDPERWKANRGPEYYTYVRHLSGVSLFDFTGFDPVDYSIACPMCSWRTFVPFREEWGASVWIEIDTAMIDGEYINATDLLARQKTESAGRHTIMPMIEAAVIGCIPVGAFRRVLLRSAGNETFEPFKV